MKNLLILVISFSMLLIFSCGTENQNYSNGKTVQIEDQTYAVSNADFAAILQKGVITNGNGSPLCCYTEHMQCYSTNCAETCFKMGACNGAWTQDDFWNAYDTIFGK